MVLTSLLNPPFNRTLGGNPVFLNFGKSSNMFEEYKEERGPSVASPLRPEASSDEIKSRQKRGFWDLPWFEQWK